MSLAVLFGILILLLSTSIKTEKPAVNSPIAPTPVCLNEPPGKCNSDSNPIQ